MSLPFLPASRVRPGRAAEAAADDALLPQALHDDQRAETLQAARGRGARTAVLAVRYDVDDRCAPEKIRRKPVHIFLGTARKSNAQLAQGLLVLSSTADERTVREHLQCLKHKTRRFGAASLWAVD
eukprot:5758573-Pleurochrysis_carterae.AAC.2